MSVPAGTSEVIIGRVAELGIIPVVVIEREADAVPLAEALSEGGLPTMEITFRTEAALRAIQAIAKKMPALLLGAGTVLTVEQLKIAVGNGARYIVSPGLQRSVVEYALTYDIPVFPGVVTPTEISSAMEMGVKVMKFFPAEASGGVEYLKAVSGPFVQLQCIPTGGINESNVAAYLHLPAVIACGGSWMVKKELVAAKKFDEIRTLTRQAVEIVAALRK